MQKQPHPDRGSYRKATAPMPLLLRRALAQLRGDPPESWPDIEEGYPDPRLYLLGVEYLNDSGPRGTLIAMLARLDRADIGRAWNIFNQRCAAIECDPGQTMMNILCNAVNPWHAMSVAVRTGMHRRVIAAAQELSDAIEAIHAAGAHINDLLPAEQRDTKAFLSIVQHMSAQSVGAASQKQTRGTKWQRIAHYIAHQVAARAGIPTGVAIANAATGATITAKALTKRSRLPDYRGHHGRIRIFATK